MRQAAQQRGRKKARKVTRRFAILELRVLTLWACSSSCRRRSITSVQEGEPAADLSGPVVFQRLGRSSETLFWVLFRQAQLAGCGAWNAGTSDVSVLTVMTKKEKQPVDVWLGCLRQLSRWWSRELPAVRRKPGNPRSSILHYEVCILD